MKKTPNLFTINPDNGRITTKPNPQAAWVFRGEGVATRKYDGSCCKVEGGKLWKRREVKKGKPIPNDFVFAGYDQITGKTVGWMPVTNNQEDKWHNEAFGTDKYDDGTYELCGPKIQGNPESLPCHILIAHDKATSYHDVPRSFDGLRQFLERMDIEGLVFHHPDGRMAKIRKKDFNLRRQTLDT